MMRARWLGGWMWAAVIALASALGTARGDDGLQREAQRRGAMFVEAVNGDEARRVALVAEMFDGSVVARVGADRLAAMLGRLHDAYAPLTDGVFEVAVFGSGESARAVLHVFAKDREGQWRDFQVRQQARTPHALTEVAFVATVTEPVALPNGAIDAPETVAWLRGYVGRLAREHDLSCSVLITGPQGTILEMQTGFMDAAGTRRNGPETRFGVASIGKTFTAAAVMRLVERGVLSLDDAVGRHVPEVAEGYGEEFGRACRVRHLLAHTSGVPEYWTEVYASERPEMKSLEGWLPWILRRPVEFEPGERFGYSNSNYILLGLIAERAGGRDYFKLVREEVLGPAGMDATVFAQDGMTAQPLEGGPGAWRVVDGVSAVRGEGVLHCSSAGGAMATPRDLERFMRAVGEGRLLGAEATGRMLEAAPPRSADPASVWSLGFELQDRGGVRSFGHGGTAPGAQGEMRMFPEEGVVVVILANQNQAAFDDLRRIVLKLVTGER